MASDTHLFFPARPPSIWGNRNIVFIWLSQLVSLFGDHIFYVAILWLTLDITKDNGIAGLVAMSIFLPMVLFSLFIGPLVDRWDRRQVMIVADACRFLLLLLFPLLHHFGWLGIIALAALAFSVQSFTSLFLPARDVLIGEMSSRQQRPSANALVQSAAPIAMITGPALAGLMLPVVGVQHLFTIDAVTFLISLIFILAVRRPSRIIDVKPQRKKLLAEVADGIRYASKHKIIGWLLFITAVDNWFIMGPAIIGLPIFAREVIGGPQQVLGLMLETSQIYTMLIVSFAFGFIFSSAFIHYLHLRLNKGRLLLLGLFLDGITYMPLAWISNPLGVAGLLFLHGLAVSPIVVSRTSLIQELVPEGMQGRVFAMINLTVTGVTALSIAFSGFLSELIGVGNLFGFWGSLAALTGPLGWMSRDLREAGVPASALTNEDELEVGEGSKE